MERRRYKIEGFEGERLNFLGLDIETEGDNEGFALQPWRVVEGSSRITMISCWKNGVPVVEKNNFQSLLSLVRKSDHKVALWNGVFDVSFMYASDLNIENIKFYDAMLLCKWLLNGQSAPMKWDLGSMANLFLSNWSKLDEFIEIKEADFEPGQDEEYWTDRAALDAEATARIADIVWEQLTPQQKTSASIQAMIIPTIAASWVNGIHIDIDKIRSSEEGIISEMLVIEDKLGLIERAGSSGYVPSKVLRSPQKLANLVYNVWGHRCERFTEKTQKMSADKTALTYLTDRDERVFDILRWRELNTILSKFVTGPIKTCEYLNSNVTHSAPRMFSTYTGRMTYSSRPRKGKGIRYGLPIHQTPRNKEVRSGVVAPPGHYLFEADASGQEMRFMAVQSRDDMLKKTFNSKHPYDDTHSLTGSTLINMKFEDFLRDKAKLKSERNAGKFVNLSNLYRTSERTLMIRARVQYNIKVNQQTSKIWKQRFLNLYPGIKDWWLEAPSKARRLGYAETLGGRRYKINRWGRENKWGSESSAINFPIQGTGADQRDVALATLIAEHPDLKYKFSHDLHDATFFVLPKYYKFSKAQAILRSLNDIDYSKYWGMQLPIPLTWEASFGPNWRDKKEITLDERFEGTLEEYYEEHND